MPYATIQDARRDADQTHRAWWDLYMKDRNSVETEAAHQKSRAIRAEVLAQFGKSNPDHPDCLSCLEASVFGGPGHEASRMCRSGKRPHCSCSACF